MSPARSYYRIESVSRLLDLMELLAEQEFWTLSESAARTGLPKTTVHHMLLTLADKGFVVREAARGRYALSLKLFVLGGRPVERLPVVRAARGEMTALQEALGETVSLMLPWCGRMLLALKSVSTKPLREESCLGSAYGILESPSGRVWLAFASAEARAAAEALMGQAAPEVRRSLDEVRRRGYDADLERQIPGVVSIAAPLFGDAGAAEAALSVSMPAARARGRIESIALAVAEAAGRIQTIRQSSRREASRRPPEAHLQFLEGSPS